MVIKLDVSQNFTRRTTSADARSACASEPSCINRFRETGNCAQRNDQRPNRAKQLLSKFPPMRRCLPFHAPGEWLYLKKKKKNLFITIHIKLQTNTC